MDYFYKPRNLDVETGTSFETFISEDPEMQDFSNKGFFIGGGGDMSKLADLLRKNFDPCATWAPALVTDAAGKFTHTFKFPDTLTRYRVIAIAHQDAARFGHAESSIVVKKDLMLEPKTPRFANQTDTFNSAGPRPERLDLHRHLGNQIQHRQRSGNSVCRSARAPPRETVTLAPGASATVIFPTRADNTGEAVLTWQATPVSLGNANLTPAAHAPSIRCRRVPLPRAIPDAAAPPDEVRHAQTIRHQAEPPRPARCQTAGRHRRHRPRILPLPARRSRRFRRFPAQLSLRLRRANHLLAHPVARRGRPQPGHPALRENG